MTHLLPPLLGVLFSYLMIRIKESEQLFGDLDARFWLGAAFMIFIEQIHGFELLASVICLIIFYYLIYDQLSVGFGYRELLLAVCVVVAYFGTFGVNSLILYILNEPIRPLNWFLVYYAGVESVIALFLFKDRL